MKLLVISPIIPEQNNIRIEYVKAVFNYLNKIEKSELFWIISQSQISEIHRTNEHIIDLNLFNNGFDIIKKIDPDCFFANHTLEPINHAVSIAARSFNIPIISFDHGITIPIEKKRSFFNSVKLFFSSNLPSEEEKSQTFFYRGKFFLRKIKFLINTQLYNNSIFSLFDFIFRNFKFYFSKQSIITPFADFYLLSGDYYLNSSLFSKPGFTKFKIVGNPYWDNISKKIKLQKSNSFSANVKVLIMTGSLYEHGYWTSTQRNNFLKNLFKKLSSMQTVSFDLKIHPSSENKEFYTKLLHKLHVKSKVHQKENLWDVASDYDILISYGYSQGITEAAYGGRKMIYIDTNLDIPYPPLLNEAFDEGHFIKCSDLDKLPKLISLLSHRKISLSGKFEKKCHSIFPKSSGNSSELIAKTILNFVSNFKK